MRSHRKNKNKPAKRDPQEEQWKLWQTNIAMVLIIKKCHRQLTTCKPKDEKNSLGKLTYCLSYIYRLHKFLSSLIVLAEEGENREALYKLRTHLIHCINSKLFDYSLIANTQAQLATMDLSELDSLNASKTAITLNDILPGIKALSFYNAIYAEPDHKETKLSHTEIETWLAKIAIPLLNILSQRQTQYFQNQEFYDARKILLLMICDTCQNGIHKELFSHIDYYYFMRACLDLRNAYSHKSLTVKVDNSSDFDTLIKVGKRITTRVLQLDNETLQQVSPFKISI